MLTKEELRQDFLKKYQEWVFFAPYNEESCCNTIHRERVDICPRQDKWRAYVVARDLYLNKKN